LKKKFTNKFTDKTDDRLLLLAFVYVLSVVDAFVAKSAYDITDVFISMVVCGVVVTVADDISAKSKTNMRCNFEHLECHPWLVCARHIVE